MITLQRALRLLFDDPNILVKLLIAAFITAFAILLTPVAVGLAGWALLFGYQVQTFRNIRTEQAHPLPAWDNIGGLFTLGVPPLIAYIIYNLPLLILLLIQAIVGGVAQGAIGNSLTLVLSCCLVPIFLIYNLYAMSLFTLGMGRYGENGDFRAFFRFGLLWDVLHGKMGDTLRWYGWALVLVIGFGVLLAIPCLGWAVFCALFVPLSGILAGLYASAVLGRTRQTAPPPLSRQR